VARFAVHVLFGAASRPDHAGARGAAARRSLIKFHMLYMLFNQRLGKPFTHLHGSRRCNDCR
jgi:hypothetical protein